MNRITRLLAALAFTIGGLAATAPPAQAFTMPAAIIADAAAMECVMQPGHGTFPGGGVSGDCTVTNNKIGNQDFTLIRYDDATTAVAYWQAQLDADQWFARDGHVIILPMGTWQTPAFDDWWAGYAAATTGGVVKHG